MRNAAAVAFALLFVSGAVARADDFDDQVFDSDWDAARAGTMVTERDGFTCPVPNATASPQQVINARIAALTAGDINGVICTYAVGSTVVMPGAVITGRPAIKNAFMGMFAMLGSAPPVVTSVTTTGPIGLLTYTVDSPTVTVPDGADTYVVRRGRIQYQTVTATIQFH